MIRLQETFDHHSQEENGSVHSENGYSTCSNESCEPSPVIDGKKHAKELMEMQKAIDKHGGRAKGVGDPTLLRFLRARSMHIEKAAKMFAHYQKWRESFVPLGYIPDEEVTSELVSNKILLHGASKRGWPVLVALASKHYPNKGNFDEFKRFVVHLLDKTLASASPGIEKMLVIVDLNHLGYKNIDIKGFITGFQFLQNYYPERLGSLYMVNANHIFINAWKIVSRILDKSTREKIVFLEGREVTAALLFEVDADVLPTIYGGEAEPVLLQDVHLPSWPPVAGQQL